LVVCRYPKKKLNKKNLKKNGKKTSRFWHPTEKICLSFKIWMLSILNWV
jgi:hypothetical protein